MKLVLLVLLSCCGPSLPAVDAGCVPTLLPDGGSPDGGPTDGCGRYLRDAPPSEFPECPGC